MEVDRILAINQNSLWKVSDGFLKFIKSIPDKTSSIIWRCIALVYPDNFIKIFKGLLKFITSHLFSNCSQVMEGWYVLWLQVHSTLVVSFRLFILIQFVPTESTIVVGLEMIWIPLNSILIVFDSHVKVSFLTKRKASVVIKVSFIRLYGDSFWKAFNGFIIIPLPVKRYPLIVIGVGIVGVDQNSLWVVLYSFFKLTNFIVGKPTVEKSFEVVRHYLQGIAVVFNGCLVVSSLTSFVALSMKLLRLLLLFLVVYIIHVWLNRTSVIHAVVDWHHLSWVVYRIVHWGISWMLLLSLHVSRAWGNRIVISFYKRGLHWETSFIQKVCSIRLVDWRAQKWGVVSGMAISLGLRLYLAHWAVIIYP